MGKPQRGRRPLRCMLKFYSFAAWICESRAVKFKCDCRGRRPRRPETNGSSKPLPCEHNYNPQQTRRGDHWSSALNAKNKKKGSPWGELSNKRETERGCHTETQCLDPSPSRRCRATFSHRRRLKKTATPCSVGEGLAPPENQTGAPRRSPTSMIVTHSKPAGAI